MATNTRKRTAADKADQPAATNDAVTTTEPDAPNPVPTFIDAYQKAIEGRDREAGAIPSEMLDTVKSAYVEVPKRQRGNLVARLVGAASKGMTDAQGRVDTSLGVAMGLLAGVIENVNEEQRDIPPPHDPVPAFAGILAAIDGLRDDVLSQLTEEQRGRLDAVDTDTDAAAKAAGEATTAVVRKVAERALKGRSRNGNGNGSIVRRPRAEIEAALVRVVREADGPLTFNEIEERGGVLQSTLWSRWDTNNTPGITAITDDKGRKAFIAANDND